MSRLGQGLPWQRIFPQPFQLPAGMARQIMQRGLPSWLLCSCVLSFISYPPPLMPKQPLVGQGLLIIEASRSHSGTPHLVEFLWTSGPHDAATLTWQHTILKTDRSPCPLGIRTHNSSKRAAADLRLIPRDHWDRLHLYRVRFIESVVEHS